MKKTSFSLPAILQNTICAALVLLVRLAAPTGGCTTCGPGRERGKASGPDVQRLRRQADIETRFLNSTPATVDGGELAACFNDL